MGRVIALDASALLALIFRERGHERVADLLDEACMSTVNLAEVLGRFTRAGEDPAPVSARLAKSRIDWVSFTTGQAAIAAELLSATRAAGLSLGDRACLALASERGIRAVTADTVWRRLDLAIEIEVIR